MKTSTNKILPVAISFLSGFCACFLLLNPSRQQPHGPAIPVAATLASTQPGQHVLYFTLPPKGETPITIPQEPGAGTFTPTQPGQPVIHLTMPPGRGTPNTLPVQVDPVDPTLPGPTQQHKDLIDTRPQKN
jgi:hypothetical protein